MKSLRIDQLDYPLDWPEGPDGSLVLRVHQTTDEEMKVHVRRSKDILKEVHGEHHDEQKDGRNYKIHSPPWVPNALRGGQTESD